MATAPSTWDDFDPAVISSPTLPLTGGTVAPVVGTPALQLLVNGYAEAVAEAETAAERVKTIREQIAEQVRLPSDAVGESITVELPYGGSVTVERGERWNWDTDVLKAILDCEDDLPEVVEQKLSIARKNFEKLNEAERKPFLPALTRKPGTLTIKVNRS